MPNTEERPGFDRRMTREEINACPIRAYPGPVHLIRSKKEVKNAVRQLCRETLLGFDTETRPSFNKGENYPPALIQLAANSAVYIFQLKHLQFPPALGKIFSNPDIIKAGVAPGRDIADLKAISNFNEAGFVDLSLIAKQVGLKNHGLRGLSAVLGGFRISKQAQTSNWNRETLTPEQIIYAATDAWVSREIFLRLQELHVV